MESKSRDYCKIRKRGNSSSSSSSLVQRYRFKRAILVGKRGGSTTPFPTWVTSTASKSPTLSMPNADTTNSQAKDPSISARKLAATLWEINKIPYDFELAHDSKELKTAEKIAKFPNLSDPSEGDRRSRANGHSRRASLVTKRLQLSDLNVDSVSNASLMEIETHNKGNSHRERVVGVKARLKDVSNGLKASKELLKTLNRIWAFDEQNSSAMSLVSALGVELDRGRVQVHQLIKDHRSNRNEIVCLLKHFEEEKAAWKSKERDRIRNAIACIAEELEAERKLRRQTERLNRKLGMELADTKASLSKAVKELENEKRAKEILEQVCDELARGIGEDRAEVEELKRQSARVKEEIEKEREMLQLADVLREERVQMKLSEARYHFEEKNAAVDRLRYELEAYLQEKAVVKESCNDSPNYERIKELEAYLRGMIQDDSCQRNGKEEQDGAIENGEVLDEDDSNDSDLHSIELNMDNSSKSFKWSYACDGVALDNLKSVSMDRDFKGRNSISDNIQWGSISFQKTSSNRPESDFTIKNQEISSAFDRGKLSELYSQAQAKDLKDEINQY